MRRFEGRVALVTGAAHGIGRAIAVRLRSEGALVALADVDEDAMKEVVVDLSAAGDAAAAGPVALAVPCDVTDRRSVDEAVAATVAQFGRLDVLVNNVGGGNGERYEEFDEEGWRHIADVNLHGAVRCIHASIPRLLESPVGGSVVSVTSVNGLTAIGQLSYGAAKAGLENLTRNLAVRYGRRNLRHAGSPARSVRFNTVAPGTVRTRVWTDRAAEGQEELERMRRLYPLDRVGEPEDIAAAVAFLASDDASWITGITLPVDGGLLTGPLGVLAPDAD